MPPTLLAVPNVSEGTSAETIDVARERDRGSRRRRPAAWTSTPTPTTTAPCSRSPARPGSWPPRRLRLAAEAVERIDLTRPGRIGQHPHVGVLDVAPIVYLGEQDRGAACAEALVLAERLGTELEIPVFLYGELTRRRGRAGPHARGAAPGRRQARSPGASPRPADGSQALRARLRPPTDRPRRAAPRSSPRARRSSPSTSSWRRRRRVEDARRIAALVREGRRARACPGCGRSGSSCRGGAAQVSMNVERPLELPLAEVVRVAGDTRAARPAPSSWGSRPPPRSRASREDLPIPGFDPRRHLIENALGS